jgi:hypothetical protein
MRPRQQTALWAAVAATGVLLAFAPAVVGLSTLSQRDTDLLYAPIRTLIVAELRGGRLPLWNPHEALGKPLFAEGIHSVLHPISLAGAALAPSSIDFLILAYLVAAALGAFVLARALGASAPASCGAGLGFALSGFAASMTGNLVFLAGYSTLPWVVVAARAAGAGARWGTVAAALATACAFLAGDVQTALVGLALGVILAGDAGGRRGVIRAIVGMGVGILLAAVQIVATYDLLPFTTRGLVLPEEQKTRWSLVPGRLLEWVIPGLFRGPLEEVPTSLSGESLPSPFADSLYLGAPLLVAAALGFRGRRHAGTLLGIAGVVLLWLAMGHYLGARQALDWVPVWSRFRYSEKLMAPVTLCICALGALGIDAFGAGRLSRTWSDSLAAIAVASAAGLLSLSLAPDLSQELVTRLLGEAGPFYRTTLAAGLPHLLVGLGLLLLVDRLRSERARASAFALLIGIASAAAVYYGAHLGSREVRRFATPLQLQDAEAPTPRIVHPVDLAYYPGDPLGAVEGFTRIESLLLGQAIGVAHRIDTVWPYGAFDPLRLTDIGWSLGDEWARFFRRFGVTHAVAQFPVRGGNAYARAIDGGQLVQRDQLIGFELWAVPHRPWAFFPRRAVAAESPQQARRALFDLASRGDEATVVVQALEPPPTTPGRVLRIVRGTQSVHVEAESEGPSLLVVQDAYWPGWRASIDGQPAEILSADFLVRAVRWPAGRHQLEMTYDPPALRFGLALSALGAALVLALGAWAVWRGRFTAVETPVLPPQSARRSEDGAAEPP